MTGVKSQEIRMCIQVSPNETKCYCNRAALQAIAEQLLNISKAPSLENFEFHLRLGLSNDDTLFSDPKSKNIWVIQAEDQISTLSDDELPSDAKDAGFEVTFMHVTEHQLDTLEP